MGRLSRIALILMTLAAGFARAQTNALEDTLSGLRGQPLNPVLLREVKAAIPAATNPVMRCRLGVLYALGSLASGNLQEGLDVRARLLKAYPGDGLLQDLDDTRISRPCGECENGRVLDPCAICGGTGRCPYCKGTGHQEIPGMGTDTRTVLCMRCADLPKRCKACGGTKGVYRACGVCGGTGLVAAPEKANILYTRLLRAMAPLTNRAPAVVVVTAAPPVQAEADLAGLRAEQVQRAVAAAKAQAAAEPLLKDYPLTAEDVRSLNRPDMTAQQKSDAVAGLMKKGLAHPTRGRFFFLPIPEGLTYCVADVVKNPYGGYFLKLTSTPPARKKGAEPPALTPREVLDGTARAICEPLGSFLSDPTVCIPDGDPRTGALRKGEVIQSGAWLLPVGLSQWGTIEKAGTCYRTADELMAQLGLNR